MSKVTAELDGDQLIIRCSRTRTTNLDIQKIDVRTLVRDKKYASYVKSHNKENKTQILFWEEKNLSLYMEGGAEAPGGDAPETSAAGEAYILFVVTDKEKILYGYMESVKAYKMLVGFVHKVLHVSLRGKCLRIWMLAYLTNRQKAKKIEKVSFHIDDRNQIPANLMVYKDVLPKSKVFRKENFQYFKIPLKNLLTDETEITNLLNMIVTVDGVDLDFRIGMRNFWKENVRTYYAPYKSCYLKDYAVHLRRTSRGNFSIVKRPKEAYEHTLRFKIMESKPVSFLLYHLGKAVSNISKRKVNLFFEKFSQKAEEGTFDLFCIARNRGTSLCYYIIDGDSEDYEKIKGERNVVKKYSLKYYWLIYRVNCYISTESPAHLNILRSNNRYFRMCTCERPFVFLQHGVTYLKCQGNSSTFVRGREGEPRYIVVGSDKEMDAVCDMLELPEERVLNTGLPIFSKIAYEHIDSQSPDKAVIMMTWKGYEQHITQFEHSEYYQNVMEVYHLLERYLAKEDIIIIPHPKMAELCENTPLGDTMWKRPISEAMEIAKLLITDYSSICYNSFYQGGGVIFYQPDLERYEKESGKLVPADNEYIGPRVFDLPSLEQAVAAVIPEGKINLAKLRTPEYRERYRSINQYSDGKNIQRIAERLTELEII